MSEPRGNSILRLIRKFSPLRFPPVIEAATSLCIVFNAQVDAHSMGGGDKIVIKLSEHLRSHGWVSSFVGCPDGEGMLSLSDVSATFTLLNHSSASKRSILRAYTSRMVTAYRVLWIGVPRNAVVWSSSDFLPDTLPASLLRFVRHDTRWVASFFLRARNPFLREVPFSEQSALNFIAQRASLQLMRLLADRILVLSEEDREFLLDHGFSPDRVVRTSGGVDVSEFARVPAPASPVFDACFVGRFHPQKGIDDLVEIWREVTACRPQAILAVVGWGSTDEERRLRERIASYGLNANIVLNGFLDGQEKISVIKNSKLLLFPSSFESWGVVVAEGICSHVPVVAYDLNVLQEHFKKGVHWVPSFDREQFVAAVLAFLEHADSRQALVDEARPFCETLDWSFVAEHLAKVLKAL